MSAGRRQTRPSRAEKDSAPVLLPFPGIPPTRSVNEGTDPTRADAATHDSSRQLTFLEELEMRQDEVIQQLDELDRRVAALLDEYLQRREAS